MFQSKEKKMTQHHIDTVFKGGMAFETNIGGHTITIDANPEFGGQDLGPSPKKLLLNSLTGCTAMDVVSMLNKMRVDFSDFSVSVTGTLTEEHPKVYSTLEVEYKIKVSEADQPKMQKAVDLSVERYCGVSAMLAKAANVTHKITYI